MRLSGEVNEKEKRRGTNPSTDATSTDVASVDPIYPNFAPLDACAVM